ncbi:hypothetical protein D3C87_941980 [compost metagenome]
MLWLGHESRPVLEFRPVAALADEGLVEQPFRDDHMRQCRQHGNIGSRKQRQMESGLYMRRTHEIDAARIDDDEFCALTQPLLQPRAENRVAIRRIGADDKHDIGLLDAVEILRAGGGAESLTETITRRRMADAGAGIDVVVTKAGADEFLDEEGFFIRAAGRGNAAYGFPAILPLDTPELRGNVREGLLPRDFPPWIADLFADHRVENAIPVGGITISKATLDAGMAAIGLPVLPRHHAHQFFTAHFRLEGAADAAIGAGRDHGMFRLANLDHRFFGKGRRRTGLHAGAAGNAIGIKERLMRAGRDAAFKTAPFDRQREGALHFLAGAHAAGTDDAFGRIIGEIGIAFVFRHPAGIEITITAAGLDVVVAFITVTYIAQANGTRHILQFAVAIGGAGQTVQRMVGDIKLHHALADLLQPLRLRVHDETGSDRRGAGGGGAVAALHLDKTEAAGAEGIHHIGGAELGNIDARFARGAHDRRSGRDCYLTSVDGERHHVSREGFGGSIVEFCHKGHGLTPPLQHVGWGQNQQGNAGARSSLDRA